MKQINFEINIPKPSIKNTSGEIIKWGDRDNYSYFLNYLFINSGLHQGIINGKNNYIYSGGIKSLNADGYYFLDDINEIIKKIIKDYEIFNGFALKFEKFNNILKCDYISIANVRILKDGSYAYCENWTGRKNIIYYSDFFDEEWINNSAIAFFGIDPFVLADENNVNSINNYPVPIYNSAIPSILTDIAIKFYNLGEIYNGFKASSIIDIIAGKTLSEPEKQDYINDLKKSIYDKNNWGAAYINFSEGDSPSVVVNPIPQTDMVDRYNAVWEAVKEDILISHQITNPLLVGIKTPGQLGGATELATSFDIFRSQYILPRRKYLLDCLKNIGINVEIEEILPNFLKQATTNYMFSSEKEFVEDDKVDLILDLFSKVGKKLDDSVKIVYEHELEEDGSGGVEDYEIVKYMQFAQNLSYNDYVILNTLNEKGNLLNLCDELSISKDRLDKSLEILKENGYIKGFDVTKAGKNLLQNTNIQVVRTYYRYTVKPGFGDPIIPTSRKFCKQMITENRIYTKKEIDMISARAGLDVWLYRGGMLRWEGKVYPWCRHYWKQVFVLEPINK
jgi:hypothetical protein